MSRNMYKGHIDKAKGGRMKKWKAEMDGVRGSDGEKMETTVLEQQKQKKGEKRK